MKKEAQNLKMESDARLRSDNLERENIDIEILADKKISEMEEGLLDLKREGATQLELANNSIGLNEDIVLKIKSELSISEKMKDIGNQTDQIFQKAKSAITRSLAIGMASMVISGCAGKFEDGQVWLGEKAEAGFSDKDLNKGSEIKYGEVARQVMIEKIKSDTYLQRLTLETDGDIEKAKRIQEERLKNAEETKIEYLKDVDSLNRIYKIMENRNTPDNEKVGGFTFISDNEKDPSKIGILEEEGDDNSADHEFSHATDRFGLNMPLKTRLKLRSLLYIDSVSGREAVAYFSNPSEVLARKHAIDVKMKELGIKKYEERYVRTHFEELLRIEYKKIGVETEEELQKYIDEGKRLPEGVEFMILYGLEGIEDIFNEVAKDDRVANKNNLSNMT